jgi:multisubunit Na+/H+ antiporter MnhG subunit
LIASLAYREFQGRTSADRSEPLLEGFLMFVWSKKLVAVLLGVFVVILGAFLLHGAPDSASGLKIHTTRWITLNYVGLMIWVFVWMIDQTRMRAKNVWIWLVPFALAPLPTLLLFVLYLQRRLKPAS